MNLFRYFILPILVVVVAAVAAKAETVTPKKPSDFKRVTVMIADEGKSSGGTGVILKSTPTSSFILTNSHICALINKGNAVYVHTSTGRYSVDQYKRSNTHDLCLIRVGVNLGIDTVVEDTPKSFGESVIVSGHPHLLPVTLTEGKLSDNLQVTLLFETDSCTEKELKEESFLCFYFGGMPIIKNFESDVISAVIAPGNSGSAVFNSRGKITGVVFAGNGRGLSHGLIVPLEHVKRFLSVESSKLEWKDALGGKRVSELRSNAKNANRPEGFTPIPKDYNSHSKVLFPAAVDQDLDKTASIMSNCKDNLLVCLRK